MIVQQVDYQYGPKKAAHGNTVREDMKLELPPSEYFHRNLLVHVSETIVPPL